MKVQVYFLVTIVMDKDPSKGFENRVVFHWHTAILSVIDILLEGGGDGKDVAKSKKDVTLVQLNLGASKLTV